MAALTTLSIVAVLAGITIGAFLRISFAIRREDQARDSLRFDPPNSSSKVARDLTGVTSSRWG
jgi:hypothetical protein